MKVAMVSLLENQFRYIPIGLIRIASYIKQNSRDIKVKIIDRTFENPEKEIEKFNPDVMGIVTYTSYYMNDIKFCKKIKEKHHNLIIVAGGVQMTTMPESINEVFDYGIVGQGEISFLKLIEKKTKLENIGGLIYRKKGKIIINPVEENIDFDNLAKMDYNLINKKYFKKRFIPEDFSFKVTSGIMTSIGCPFTCVFCSIRVCWKKPIYRKLERVVEEIKDLYFNYKVRNMYIHDDLFALKKERIKELIDLLKKENLLGKITFCISARADIFSEEICKLLKELNIVDVAFGFESGSNKILKYIKNNPNITIEDNLNAIKLCKKYGINTGGSLMVGMPYEKKEDMEKTIKFMDYAKENGASKMVVFVFTLFPKTEVWELAKSQGIINENNIRWEKHNLFEPLTAKMLDESVTITEFLEYYNTMKKKAKSFVRGVFIKTLLKNPINLFYFLIGGKCYLKRYLK